MAILAVSSYSQTPQTQTVPSDTLGLNCGQMLAMSSSQWMDRYTSAKGDSTNWVEQGLAIYGQCYDQRTEAIATSLNNSGKGPLMGGMGNLHDVQSTLQAFTTQALNAASSGGTFGRIQAAYTTLYQKQFTYQFYQQYVSMDQQNPPVSDPKSLNQAKQRLGELVSQYPGTQGENLQNAFDQFETNAVEGCGIPELIVYQYAIMILQSPADPPFSKPPF